MESPIVRPFREADIDFAHRLDSKEGWNDTRNDIERMFLYEPDGCFVAEVDGQSVGHVFTVNYVRVGWIGFLIVSADFRRRGIGTLLMKRAMDFLLNHDTKTLRLEAVPEIANLYRRLRFEDEYDSLRLVGNCSRLESSTSSSVSFLRRKQLEEISKFDAEYFGANRIKVLERLYQENPEGCLVFSAKSKVKGYIMSRAKQSGYAIGPWVCDPSDHAVAHQLLSECLGTMEKHETVYVGVPSVNKIAVQTLERNGFRRYSRSIRMSFGSRIQTECVEGLFAIAGPEKG